MKIKLSKKTFLTLFILIVVIAFLMRSYKLNAKPIHHDEAILEYYYIEPLLENYALEYLGIEYHGLMPHFLTYPFVRLFGLSAFSMRFAVAFFGTLTVALLYFLKDYIGRIGVLFSAAFLAVSPNFVYYSRQYTGYPFLIFFLLLLIIVVLKFLKEFRNYQLYLIFILLAMILNINETFFVFLFIVIAFFYLDYMFNKKKIYKRFLKKIKWKHLTLAILIFIFVFVMIHTNFFFQWSNLEGLLNIVSDVSTKTVSTGHNKSFPYYFTLLFPFELGLLLIGAIGLFCFKKDRFSYFLIFWSLTSLFIFSLISYKTNWTLPVIILPLILHFGNTMDHLIERFRLRDVVLIAGILLVLISLFFSIQQNFIFYNDFEKNKIGYVETSHEVEQLVSDIWEYSQDESIDILITAHGYWPLPSYLRAYNLSYLTEIDKIDLNEYSEYDAFISDKSQVPDTLISFTEKEYELRDNYHIAVLYKD
jgi:uncharacterized protein (TIGR03663 family)